MATKNKLAEYVLEIRTSDKPPKWLAHHFGVNLKSIYDARRGGVTTGGSMSNPLPLSKSKIFAKVSYPLACWRKSTA
jgi:hypothetical protein